MSFTTGSLERAAERAGKELLTAIRLGEVTYSDIESLLSSYRNISQHLLFHDFTQASSVSTETYLWNAHVKVNEAFRAKLRRFETDEGRKKVVERRKLEMHHESFIKSSQSSYRGLIQHLASHFANVAEVLEAARKIKSSNLSVDEPIVVDGMKRKLVIQLCHSALVRLGDLSRYRESFSQSKNKNWGPAQGYYDLAITLYPSSGIPYNQLAAIARSEFDALRTSYYLYRALTLQTPHPEARKNLEKDFKIVRGQWDKKENHSVKDGVFTRFQNRFIAFHAKSYTGIDFEEHRDLETELLHEIGVTLLHKLDIGLLNKICLVNIAAEAVALERLNDEEGRSLRAYHVLQTFNIKLISQLLKVLCSELQRIKKLVASSEMSKDDSLTPLVRHLLPVLRQYSSWLYTNIPRLIKVQTINSRSTALGEAAGDKMRQLWTRYVDVLAGLASTYPLKGGRVLKYLLAEDEDTVAFKPFCEDRVPKGRFFDDAGNTKMRSTDLNAQKGEPREEMIHRIRGIVKYGMVIAQSTDPDRKAPIRFIDGKFLYFEEDLHLVQPEVSGQIIPSQSLSGSLGTTQVLLPGQGPRTALEIMDTETRDMADDLLGDERAHVKPTSRHSSSGRKASPQNATFTAADFVRQIQRPSRSPPSHAPQPPSNSSRGASPFPSGLVDPSASGHSSARPSASQPFQTPGSPLQASAGHSFTNQLKRQQQEIEERSSPHRSLPQSSSWTEYQTPTGFNTFLNAQARQPQRSPPWLSPTTTLEAGEEEIKKPLPRRNLFGAIGDMSGRTPTSAQPG